MTARNFIASTVVGALLPGVALAFSMAFPAGAVRTGHTSEPMASYQIPVGPFDGTRVPTVPAEGRVSSEAWRVTTTSATSLQIMRMLRQQLIDDGFQVVLECDAAGCGGFDFRYQLDLLPEPEMHVDLGDYRYLSAQKLGPKPEFVSLVVSRGGQAAYIQLTRVSPADDPVPEVVASTRSPDPALADVPDARMPIGERLLEQGHAALEDLSFPSGSAELGSRHYASLGELADWLAANPGMKVALVGHTDAQGSLQANLSISRKRAVSVMRALIDDYGVSPDQLEAAGVGYLVPRDSNLTPEGRRRNRRVEAIVTSTR